jgi:hypothetical protein
VAELNSASFYKRSVGATGGKCEPRLASETDLAEEVTGNPSAGSEIIGAEDNRCGAVTHHYKIH